MVHIVGTRCGFVCHESCSSEDSLFDIGGVFGTLSSPPPPAPFMALEMSMWKPFCGNGVLVCQCGLSSACFTGRVSFGLSAEMHAVDAPLGSVPLRTSLCQIRSLLHATLTLGHLLMRSLLLHALLCHPMLGSLQREGLPRVCRVPGGSAHQGAHCRRGVAC